MSLTSPVEVRRLLHGLSIRPSKALGQNFLVDENILRIFLDAAEIAPDDEVLEIGPGLGVLTERLVSLARHVIAVEKDRRLFDFLVSRMGSCGNLTLVHGDVLDLDADALLGAAPATRVVTGNLPYRVGTRILVDMVHAPAPPARITVTVQQEVAERLAALPGSGSHGLLSVWVQLTHRVRIVKTVAKGCFWPRPEVASAIVSLSGLDAVELDGEDRAFFYALTKLGFAHRRKQLATVLKSAPGFDARALARVPEALESTGLDARSRPEDLPVSAWCALVRHARGRRRE
ncbi:16S rRNA (adenine(1518)-N(6)/adenine(1519)-N(6))-dimethyltransferase RsmA [Verrucomicrobiota bacterium]